MLFEGEGGDGLSVWGSVGHILFPDGAGGSLVEEVWSFWVTNSHFL